MTGSAYKDVFGAKAAQRKGKHGLRAKWAKRHEKQVIRKFERKRDAQSVTAIVAVGIAFKANVAVDHAYKVAHPHAYPNAIVKEQEIREFDLLDALRRPGVWHKAEKQLKRQGVALRGERYPRFVLHDHK